MSITFIIIILTCLISIQAFNNHQMFDRLKHFPYFEKRERDYVRWFTSGLIHGDYVHLAINMFVLYSFGRIVEKIYMREFGTLAGEFIYLGMYISAIAFANLPTFRKHGDNPNYMAVGASGAVSAVTFTFLLFFPWEKIYLYGIIGLPAIVWGVIYLVYEQWASKNSKDNIGHDAHFAGAVYGMLFVVLLKPSVYNDFVNKILYNSPYW